MLETRTTSPTPSETAKQIGPPVPNVNIRIGKDNLPRVLPLARKVYGFVGKTSRLMGNNFSQGFMNCQINPRAETQGSILSLLQERSLVFPQFEIHDYQSARKFLDDVDFETESIGKNNLLLVFKLPRLSALAWTRVDKKPESEVRKNIWGKLGKYGKNVLWQNISDYTISGQLEFRRINEARDHDSEKYHYLLEVKFPESKEDTNGKTKRRITKRQGQRKGKRQRHN